MPTESEERQFFIDQMKLYIDNSKSFIQISAAALILPSVLIDKFLQKTEKEISINWSLKVSWLCFLIAIGSGLIYQYLAVKCIENEYLKKTHENRFVKEPGKWAYGPMLISFYVGALALVYYCATIL